MHGGLEAFDRIALSPEGLLLGITQLIGVRQRVTAEAVGHALQQGGAFTGAGAGDRALGGITHRQHIHAVDFFAVHAEASSFAPDLGVTGGALVGHADGPLVVLHHKQDGQLPQLRHVQAFVELADVAGAIAKERGGDGIAGAIAKGITLVAAGEGRTQRHGNAFADEGIATEQVVLFGEQVHRATTALGAAGLFAKQLTHHLAGRHARAEGMHVVAVGAAEPVVLGLHGLDHATGDRFLPVVEVHEAKHLAAVVHLRAFVLKPSPQNHVPVDGEGLLTGQIGARLGSGEAGGGGGLRGHQT